MQGAQGQDHLDRRRQGHHAHLRRAHAGADGREAAANSTASSPAPPRARFSALQSGAVDAAILAPPYSFRAEAAGFTNLGCTFDYVKDLPFAGMVVNRTWAAAKPRVVDRLLAVMNKSIAWFYDPKNRAEAVKMMVEVSRMQADDVEKSYDFLHRGKLFEPTGKVSRTKLAALVAR